MLLHLERWAVLIALLSTCLAGRARAADEHLEERPPPRKVYTSFHIIKLADIDSARQTFDADFYLRLRWFDPKYLTRAPGTLLEAAEWRPRVDLINAKEYSTDLDMEPKLVGPGLVQWTRRYRGTFSAPMDLHNFPFDRQRLPIVIEDGEHDATEVVWVLEALNTGPVRQLHERENVGSLEEALEMGRDELAEWRVLGIDVKRGQHVYPFFDNAVFSRFEINLTLARKTRFYEFKIILVLVLIVVMSWLAFFLKAESLGERSAICTSALLAIIAHNYVASTILPPISYLTTLDYLLLGGMGFVLFAALESLYVYRLLHGPELIRGQPASEIARMVDMRCIAAAPVLLVLALIASYLS
jgi:hypothetical protein